MNMIIDPAAIRRVRDRLPVPTHCRYCQFPVELVNNEVMYGQPAGVWPWAYRCTHTKCHAHVGCHPGTAIPMGTLADQETRHARTLAHLALDPLSSHMTRTQAYKWLAHQLGIKHRQCHISWFDLNTCHLVVAIGSERFG